MANLDAPFGARPIRHRSGAPYNGACNMYYVPSTDSTAMFIGDFVEYATANMTSEGAPYIQQHTAGNPEIIGVIVGFEPATAQDTVYRAASTARYVWVADDPDLTFEIQNDGFFSVTQTHHYADVIVGTGSTVTGLSAMELDSSTLVTEGTPSATASLRVLRLAAKENNVAGTSTTDTNGQYAVVEVMINQHTWYTPQTT